MLIISMLRWQQFLHGINGNQKFITSFKNHLKRLPVFKSITGFENCLILIPYYQWRGWQFASCWLTKLQRVQAYLRSFPLHCLRRFSAEKQRFGFRREFWVYKQSFFFLTLFLELVVALVLKVMKLNHRLQWREATPEKFKPWSCMKMQIFENK